MWTHWFRTLRILECIVLERESPTDLHERGLQDRSRRIKAGPNCIVPGQDGAGIKGVVQVDHKLQAGMFSDWNDLGDAQVHLVNTVGKILVRRSHRNIGKRSLRDWPTKRA